MGMLKHDRAMLRNVSLNGRRRLPWSEWFPKVADELAVTCTMSAVTSGLVETAVAVLIPGTVP